MSTICENGVYTNDRGDRLDVVGEASAPESAIHPFSTLGGIYYALGASNAGGRERLLVTAESLADHGYTKVSDLIDAKIAVVPVSVLASAIITVRTPDYLKKKGVA